MKIGILVAMDKELKLLLPILENMVETEVDGHRIFKGNIGNNEVGVMKCGIGKVNSALNTYRMIHSYKPELIINTGVAGGADKSMKIGTLLVAEYAAYHDVWCGPGTKWGQADGFSQYLPCSSRVLNLAHSLLEGDGVRFGLICSGDTFISKAEEIKIIKSNFPEALACDMESTSIAQVCTESNVEFAILRVVSDTPGEGENISQYQNFWTEAPEKTFEAVKTLISAIQ